MSEPRAKRSLPPDIPPEVVPFLESVGYLQADSLAVGDLAPDVPLFAADGGVVNLRRIRADRPVVLIFGSHT